MAIKITISKQMVACDKQKRALVCFWSVIYQTRAFFGLGNKTLDLRSRAFPGQEKHSCDIFQAFQLHGHLYTLYFLAYFVFFAFHNLGTFCRGELLKLV
jgi:hypothetical protein